MIALTRKERRRTYCCSGLEGFSINPSLVESFLENAHEEDEQARLRFENALYNEKLDRNEMLGWDSCLIFSGELVLLFKNYEWTGLSRGESLLFIGETAVEFLRFLKEEYIEETARVSKMITKACAALDGMKEETG